MFGLVKGLNWVAHLFGEISNLEILLSKEKSEEEEWVVEYCCMMKNWEMER